MKLLRWLYPGLKVKRWLLLFSVGFVVTAAGLALVVAGTLDGRAGGVARDLAGRLLSVNRWEWGIILVMLGLALAGFSLVRLGTSFALSLEPRGRSGLGEVLYRRRQLVRGPRLVVIGGGTGLPVLLRGLKEYTSNLTAVVTVCDDGGSSGRLRGELGILPPGDLRNCLVALADTEPLVERLFLHRFGEESALAGHSFGNLFIATLWQITGDFREAVRESSEVLAVRGQVLPSTLRNTVLCAELEDGRVVRGESRIPTAGGRIRRVYLDPPDAEAPEEVLQAIRAADAVVLGPGSLYTSILPNLLVRGVAEALRSSRAVKFYVCNIMTQPGETDGYTVADHLEAIQRHGGPGLVDLVVANTGPIPEALAERYRREGAEVVRVPPEGLQGVRVLSGNLVAGDGFVRHDPVRLAELLLREVVARRMGSERRRFLDFYLLGERLKHRRGAGPA